MSAGAAGPASAAVRRAAPAARPPLVRLAAYARPYRRRWLAAAACSVLNKLFDLAPPVLIGTAVDIAVRREQSLLAAFGIAEPAAQLVWLGLATLLIWGLESLFQYAQAWLWRTLAQAVQHELRLDAYAHIQRLELGWFEGQRTGRLLAILNDDINQLERFLDGGANDLLQLFTSVLLIGALFFYLAPEVAWMAMLPMPAVLWGSLRYQRWLAPRYAEVRERAGQLGAQLASNLEGIATIKAFCAEQREWERIRRTSEAYRDSNRRAIRLSAAFTPLIRMVIVLGFTAMLVFGGLQVLEGSLAVGAYSVLVFMTQRLLWPLTRLGGMLDLYQRAMASTTRVLDLLDTPVAIRDGRTRLARGRVRGEVRFEGVRFAYPGRPPLFEDLTLQIAPGEMVGIVGASGAGKTTLIKLLLRLYEPQAGRVLLDGRDVRELRLEDLRAAIGLVAQEVFLFDGTIHENIAYGTGGDPAPHEIERAAQLAEADGFIRELPLGYRTRIGERGVRLSVGQRQRLAIARALLKEPPVLVFDEATSAVDNETEAAIQRSLARVAAGRTTIVIAHRLSTVRHADRIVVLECGQVREQGTHAELLAAGGLYAALWRVQTGEAESALAAPR